MFVGASNIVVEGTSDKRLIVASIQAFGDPSDVERLLNLNRVTIISAGGSPHVRRVVEQTTRIEMTPVVVVMLDADNPGDETYHELVEENVLPKQFVKTIRKLSSSSATARCWRQSEHTDEHPTFGVDTLISYCASSNDLTL